MRVHRGLATAAVCRRRSLPWPTRRLRGHAPVLALHQPCVRPKLSLWVEFQRTSRDERDRAGDRVGDRAMRDRPGRKRLEIHAVERPARRSRPRPASRARRQGIAGSRPRIPRSSDSLSTSTSTEPSVAPVAAARIAISDATHEAAAARRNQPGDGAIAVPPIPAGMSVVSDSPPGPVTVTTRPDSTRARARRVAVAGFVRMLREVGARFRNGVRDRHSRPPFSEIASISDRSRPDARKIRQWRTTSGAEVRSAGASWAWVALLLLPVLGLLLLLARPELDVEWEHHPSHFWLVLFTAAVNVALAYLTNIAAGRYRDARLILVSLGLPRERRVPRSARARDAGRPPPPPQHRVRRRDADRAAASHRSSPRRPSARSPDLAPRPCCAGVGPARRPRRAHDRLGSPVPRETCRRSTDRRRPRKASGR